MHTDALTSDAWIIANEGVFRLSIFLGLFVVMAGWELTAPKRRLTLSKGRRWMTNGLITALDLLVVRVLLMTIGAVGAWDAAQEGWGLFNWLDWPVWIEVIIAIVVLDLVIYWQHVISHRVPALWRIHRVHHSDRDLDVTTAVRFHPIEIALSMLLKLGVIYLLGAAAVAVILFEALLNGAAMFNHSNIRLPDRIERMTRLFLVTPDMHRVHHSTDPRETDANFGFSVPWWDRLFGTYIAQPVKGHDGMTIGLDEYQDDKPAKLGWSLRLPFSH